MALPRALPLFLLAAFPHGGQLTARRNAWAAMSADLAVARDRREAEAAIAQALSIAALPQAAVAGGAR